MRISMALLCAGASLFALPATAIAQEAGNQVAVADDIIVTARRKDETIRDVPLTVNAIGAETIQNLNIRDLKDISSVVPGLVLSPGLRTTGAIASLRGVNVDVNSSGNNGTVEFYLNDAPTSAGAVLQSIFDIGQIEVLRGPQGTLRGRAAPSGSITITTRRPDLDAFGGYAEGTVTSLQTMNLQGAVNAPIVEGVLALRVAGLVENNQANRVSRLDGVGADPSARTRAIRASLRLTPTDTVEINASYSRLTKNSSLYDQVESANLATGAPVVGALVSARDRHAVQNVPRENRQTYEQFNGQARWSFAGQRLDYVGAYATQNLDTIERLDRGDFFDASYPGDASAAAPNLQNLATLQSTSTRQQSHELRLSSDDRVLGMFDYIVGGLINRNKSPSHIVTRTPVFAGAVTPANFRTIVDSPTVRGGRTLEKAVFGNLTFHLGEQTELSGGIRYIHFQDSTNTPGNATDVVHNAMIWTASAKHRFSDDLMVYANAGTSWRLSSGTNPIILARSGINPETITDPFLASVFDLRPERSRGYEIGVKSSWLDRKLDLSLSAFRQTFRGYIFSTAPVYVTNYTGTTYENPVRTVAGLGVGVPAKVTGVEAEIAFRPSNNFNLGASLAYARSRISNGQIPCSPVSPPASNPPTIADVQGGSPSQQVAACLVSQPASTMAPFSASLRTEYSHPVADSAEGFLRGLLDFKGRTRNEPQNPYDDVSSYGLINFFAGLRSDEGGWEVALFAKNLFNTFEVLSRDNSAVALRTSAGTVLANYRLITTTEPREFGITARIAFGSR